MVANQRWLAESYRIRGSERPPGLLPSALVQKLVSLTWLTNAPFLLKIEKLPLSNATKLFGPAAPIVSGGSMIPDSALVWLRVIVVKFAPVLNDWPLDSLAGTTTVIVVDTIARAISHLFITASIIIRRTAPEETIFSPLMALEFGSRTTKQINWPLSVKGARRAIKKCSANCQTPANTQHGHRPSRFFDNPLRDLKLDLKITPRVASLGVFLWLQRPSAMPGRSRFLPSSVSKCAIPARN